MYLYNNNEVVGYLVYCKCRKWFLQESNHNDVYTIFITVSPSYRGKGFSSTLIRELFLGNQNANCRFYKIISINNVSSVKAAESNGYHFDSYVKRSKILKRIIKTDIGNAFLYSK